MGYLRQAGAAALVTLWMALLGGTQLPAQAQDMLYNQSDLIRFLLPTVVNIIAHAQETAESTTMTAAARQPSPSFLIKSSAGAGFIVDPAGIIVTNWHVVDGAYEIFVTFSDGTRVHAEVLNAARIIDLALLRVKVPRSLPSITWGDSTKVQVGEPVLAIGNPLGVGLSVSAGIVSALNRNIQDTPYDDFIQTDAAINHGNSGGPLFNLKGEVIGVNTALISPTSASAGLGFALPSQTAEHVIRRLMTYGWARPAWLGVKLQQVTPEMAEALGQGAPRGSVLAWVVPGGPAEKAGLRIGDVIVQMNETEPTDERALLRQISSSAPGETVTLKLLRDGGEISVAATLAEWPRMQWELQDAPIKVTAPHWLVPADLGLQVTEITEQLRAENDIPTGPVGTKAVFVTGVTPDTDASRRGISRGDLVLRVGATPVATAAEMQREIDRTRAEKRPFAMLLVFPKDPDPSKWAAPKWVALRVVAE